MPSNSSMAGEMKPMASQRSLIRGDRPGAGGVPVASCTGWSVVVLMTVGSQPAAAAGVQHLLLLRRDVVECVLRALGPVEGRIHVGVLDVDELGVLRHVPHVPQPGDRI